MCTMGTVILRKIQRISASNPQTKPNPHSVAALYCLEDNLLDPFTTAFSSNSFTYSRCNHTLIFVIFFLILVLFDPLFVLLVFLFVIIAA